MKVTCGPISPSPKRKKKKKKMVTQLHGEVQYNMLLTKKKKKVQFYKRYTPIQSTTILNS